MRDETTNATGKASKIPAINMGLVKPVSSEGSNGGGNSAKPKMGLDLSKAQKLQEQHLKMAEEKKNHARETAF